MTAETLETLETSEANFLHKLFSDLNSSGIRYAVMRNHLPLPYSSGGSDLDLMVAVEDGARTRILIYKAIEAANGVALGLTEIIGFFKIYAMGHAPGLAYPWWGLCIDVNVGLYFKGHPLLTTAVEWPLCKYRNINVLGDGFSGVLGILKEVLNNGIFPVRYETPARTAAREGWVEIETLLAPIGKTALDQLRLLLLAEVPAAKKGFASIQVRRALLRHAFCSQPIAALQQRLCHELNKIRRYLNPPGIVVAILGVDGAGKSTVIDAILPALNAATHNSVFVQHLRPNLLPPLARLKGRSSVPMGPVVEPHGSMPSGLLGSFFRLGYLTLDYIFGYWLKTRPKISKQPTVVIFDRYAYDMALDPRRFRIGLSGKVAGWFAALAPKPDLIFCLHGDPDVICARKRELPIEETRRQVDALRAFAAREPRAVLIATDTGIEETRDLVLQTLCDFLQNRSCSSRK